MSKSLLKAFRYRCEWALAYAFVALCGALPPKTAANLGGFIARSIGPRIAASRKARRQIARIWPNMTDARIRTIEKGMWNNLGRVLAEYPHLHAIARRHSRVVGMEHMEQARAEGKNIQFLSAHLANWEMNPVGFYHATGEKMGLVYRAPNNPLVRKLLDRMRGLNGKFVTIPKSRAGNRVLIETYKAGLNIGVLIDQKYNEGIPVPFLGFPAMTSTAFVTLAQKYNYALIPARTVREANGDYMMEMYPQLSLFDESGSARPPEVVIAEIHTLLEQWIVEHPEQWLWLHRRWSSKAVVDLPRVKSISEPA